MFFAGFKKVAAIQDQLLDDTAPRAPSGDNDKKKKPKSGGPSCPVTSVLGTDYPR